jgi:adenosylhomocysteinase
MDGLIQLPHAEDHAIRFFRRLRLEILRESGRCRVIVVTHLLPDRPIFLDALNDLADIAAIIPKPKSVHGPTREIVERKYKVLDTSREDLANLDKARSIFGDYSQGEPTIILDIGGYFAKSAEAIKQAHGETFVGVVEDTENGQQRYERLPDRKTAVYSVARSPLKEPEDHLTGESVVFSMERLLRMCNEVIYGRRAAVFGYGKVGRSAARALATRGVRVSIVDTNPVRAIEASAHGFRVLEKKTALATADLILGATGNFSLKEDDFRYVRNGCFIASVTSSDDELDIAGLGERYQCENASHFVSCYSRQGHYFYVLNEGNALNFLDGAVLGPYIHLVQAEILAAMTSLLDHETSESTGIESVNSTMRQRIAALWVEVFNDNRIVIPGTL